MLPEPQADIAQNDEFAARLNAALTHNLVRIVVATSFLVFFGAVFASNLFYDALQSILPVLFYTLPFTIPLALGSGVLFVILANRLPGRTRTQMPPVARSTIAFESAAFGFASLLPVAGLIFVPCAFLCAYLVFRDPKQEAPVVAWAIRSVRLSLIGLFTSLGFLLLYAAIGHLGRMLAP
jgi:hypothetical protein